VQCLLALTAASPQPLELCQDWTRRRHAARRRQLRCHIWLLFAACWLRPVWFVFFARGFTSLYSISKCLGPRPGG
jgi:hypothetical protein